MSNFWLVKAQTADVGSLDRLRSVYHGAKTDSAKVVAMIELAEVFADSRHDFLDSAVYYLRKSIKLSTSKNVIELRLYAYKVLAIVYAKKEEWKNCRASYQYVLDWHLGRNEIRQAADTYDFLHTYFYIGANLNFKMIKESISFCKKERLLYQKLKDTMAVIKSIKDQGDVSLYIRSLDSADMLFNTALEMYKQMHYKNLHNVYYLMAASSRLRGDLYKELYYRQQTIASMLATKDTVNQKRFYIYLAITYEQLKRYKTSVDQFKKLAASYPNDPYICWYIVRCLISSGQKQKGIEYFRQHVHQLKFNRSDSKTVYNNLHGIYYQALGQFNKAETYYLQNANNNDDEFSTMGATSESKIKNYRIIASFYIEIGRLDKASIYLKKIDDIPQFNIDYLMLSDIELLKFKVDSAKNNYVSAIRHYQGYKTMLDSIMSFTRARQISDLEVKRATEQRDQNILILKKQSLLDQERFIKNKTIGQYFFISTLLLAVMLGAMYRSYFLKQRSVQLLKEKQEEIIGKNVELEHLVKDNEWLVSEVHHRVKNNLHIIMSLLHSQSKFLKDDLAINAVLDSQHRVHAMSLIHQKLYKTGHSTAIYMPEYVNELVGYLKQSFKTSSRIIFTLQVEPLYFDVGIAVPVGLILNEAITNALKYAFSDQRDGQLIVELTCPDHQIAYLKIADDGPGLPTGFDLESSESFGMRLLRGLIVDDLGGKFDFSTSHGTALMMSFDINPSH